MNPAPRNVVLRVAALKQRPLLYAEVLKYGTEENGTIAITRADYEQAIKVGPGPLVTDGVAKEDKVEAGLASNCHNWKEKERRLARWIAAGRPLRTQQERDRLAQICEECIDEKCRQCPVTHASRWAATEGCPLGLWTKE